MSIDSIITRSSYDFNAICIEIFQYQAKKCLPYKQYLDFIKCDVSKINHYHQIPFFPIQFFKNQKVYSLLQQPQIKFTSSLTTGMHPSVHFVYDITIYNTSIATGFKQVFGNPGEYCILGLLPGYLERQGSSLIHMVNYLQSLSGHPKNGFYLNNFNELKTVLLELEKNKTKTILFGIPYALLDFGAQFNNQLKETIIIETGGMKGKRKEMIREELHTQLKTYFGKDVSIFSEYGMTELLSQAWAKGNIYYCPPWMKILIREKNDPLHVQASGNGLINIIDLANIESCSFIATDDLGKLYNDGGFEVLGRTDNRDIRGCNLLYSE